MVNCLCKLSRLAHLVVTVPTPFNRRPVAILGRQWLAAVTIAAFLAPPALADIHSYSLVKSLTYEQAADGPPAHGPTGAFGAVDLISDPADLTSAHVLSVSPSSPMVLAHPRFSYRDSYSTLEELDEDFPVNISYAYKIDGGTAGMQTGFLTLPSRNLFAESLPHFTNNAFSNLQGIHPDSALVFKWNGYTPDPLMSFSQVVLRLTRLAAGVWEAGATHVHTGPQSHELPANSLDPLTNYRASLLYSSRIDTPNAGFSGATSQITFDVLTELYFTTGPDDGDYNRNGTVDAADYVVWRDTLHQTVPIGTGADGDLDGQITPADYDVWRTNFGEPAPAAGTATVAVPEPATPAIILCGLLMTATARRRCDE